MEDIDGSNDYIAIERIPSHVAYQWMVDFMDEMVAPIDEQAAEKLSIALNGKGAFRRFKDTLHRVDEQWLQAWYQWRDKQLKTVVDEWAKSDLELASSCSSYACLYQNGQDVPGSSGEGGSDLATIPVHCRGR